MKTLCAAILFWALAPFGYPRLHASIVYFDMADVQVSIDCLVIPPFETITFPLDIDGDGSHDVIFASGFWDTLDPNSPAIEVTLVGMEDPGRSVGQTPNFLIPEGQLISAIMPWPWEWQAGEVLLHGGIYDFDNPVPCDCSFTGPTGFIGFEFDISGDNHYAWMRVTLHPSSGAVILRDYAYESEPGVGIIAGAIPEPSTILLLSLGALGVLWRRLRMDRGARTRC